MEQARSHAAGRWRRASGTLVFGLAAVLLAAGCSAGHPAHRPFVQPSDEPLAGAPLGNQIGDLDSAAILQRAQAATAAASFVRVKGQLAGHGEDAKPFGVEMSFTSTGSDGTIHEGSASAHLTRVQNQVWFQGDQNFWDKVDTAGSSSNYRGKYVQVPVNDKRFTGLVENTYIERLVAKLLGRPGNLQKGETRNVNGHPSIALVDRTPGGGGTIWVSTDGAPYLTRIETATGARNTGAVDFLGYNERTVVEAPDPANVVDKNLTPGPRSSSHSSGGSSTHSSDGDGSSSGSDTGSGSDSGSGSEDRDGSNSQGSSDGSGTGTTMSSTSDRDPTRSTGSSESANSPGASASSAFREPSEPARAATTPSSGRSSTTPSTGQTAPLRAPADDGSTSGRLLF